MKTLELEVLSRLETGKGFNRRLRNEGMIPAVLYGASKKNFNIKTSRKTMTVILKGENENVIITLKSAEPEVNGKLVLIKDWDRDVMTRLPLHADFYEIDLKKAVRVKVPLHFTGKAKGVAEGGLISPIVREIEVDCLPTAIPDFIEVDVTNLGIHDSIHIDELVVPDGVTKHYAENFTLVTCTIVKEEAAPVVDPNAPAAATEPEVIAKGKKDEEGETGAAGAKPAAGAGAKPAAGAGAKPAAGGAKPAAAKGDKK